MSNGHIRQRSPGSFEIRYRLSDGKVATATVRGGRRDAERELRRLLRQVDTGEHIEPAKITVQQWLETWLATVNQAKARRTHQRYADISRRILLPALGKLPLTKLAPLHIQRMLATIPTPAGVRGAHTILAAALTGAVETGLLIRNPCAALKKQLPRIERQEMVTLTGEQSRLLLDAAAGGPIHAPVLLALSAGLRRGEALALLWKDVDLDRGVARIIASVEQIGREVRRKKPKGEKARSIILPAFTVDAVRRLKLAQAEDLLRIGVRQSGDTAVCARADGTTPTPVATTIAFHRLVLSLIAEQRGDFPRIHYHSLRHTHATHLLAAGVHPKIAQERLGHANIRMTLDLYSHVSETMQSDAAAKIDEILR
jgi:integrase